jgi:DNA polymerase family B
MLNYLYGKFGQKDIENRIKFVSNDEANKILKGYHVSYFASISDENVLIKYSSKLNEKLRRLYSKEDKLIKLETNFKKDRGVVSAVQISCAIAAYARLSINPFKNSNKLYYSDTDSLVLEQKLSDNIVGKELGQWKLEAIIKKGIFLRPKLYGYYTDDGSLKKVASG